MKAVCKSMRSDCTHVTGYGCLNGRLRSFDGSTQICGELYLVAAESAADEYADIPEEHASECP